MSKRNSKAFTLIELIGVLVIMAIIALIVTPLVLNIIRKARVSSDRRSVDAYGRSIELAIAGYLLDTGKFPTEVSQLTIEYSGNEVVCTTTQINSDSSVYLSGCTVAGRSVENYTYGEDKTPQAPTYTAYQVGDTVTYNNINYYVIKDSSASDDSVKLLKAEPLSVEEVNQFGVGHVNNYTNDSVGTAYNKNGYGGMAYYTSETCGYVNSSWLDSGCTTDYAASDIKQVVDAWKNAKAPAATEARLITKDEIDNNFEFEEYDCCGGCGACKENRFKDSWMYNRNYRYWTISQYNNSDYYVWGVEYSGSLIHFKVNGDHSHYHDSVVRPVIVLPKSALTTH